MNYVKFLMDDRQSYSEAELFLKKILDVNPDNVDFLIRQAMILAELHKKHDEAEVVYKKALEINPADPHAIQGYARFLTTWRKDYKNGEALHKKVSELVPDNIDSIANLASMLFCKNQPGALDGIPALLDRATMLFSGPPTQTMAEVLFYKCLYSELTTSAAGVHLAELKSLLKAGFERGVWDFSHVLESIREDISPDKFDFYQSLADAILDQKKLPSLESFQLWNSTEEIDSILIP